MQKNQFKQNDVDDSKLFTKTQWKIYVDKLIELAMTKIVIFRLDKNYNCI